MHAATIAVRPNVSFNRHALTVARVLLGLVFFMSGLEGFLHFIPQPTSGVPEGAAALGKAMFDSGYLMPLITGTELFVGALLLSNRFVPLALVVLAPVLVNIIAFHVFLAPAGLVVPLVLVALTGVLAWSRRSAYAPLFAGRAS